MQQDPETHKLLTDGDHVRNMTESDGWRIVKPKLDARILDLQNINNIDVSDPATVTAQILARKMASDSLYIWLHDDVYGFIDQQENNKGLMKEERDTGFIDRGSE